MSVLRIPEDRNRSIEQRESTLSSSESTLSSSESTLDRAKRIAIRTLAALLFPTVSYDVIH
eukprot:682241-Pyramimonas_sp.AAC.2